MNKECNFERWADLMNRVYPQSDNGKWALLYAVMCIFELVLRGNLKTIPPVFFTGPAASGKTQIATSIRSLFLPSSEPVISLTTCRDSELATVLNRYGDAPVILDEFNYEISDFNIQGINRSYSGIPIILCGQQIDGLFDELENNRSIFVFKMPETIFSQEQADVFRELKALEAAGAISGVLPEIRKLIQSFITKFDYTRRRCLHEIMASVGLMKTEAFSDMYDTASLFLTVCKFLDEYTSLVLPFDFHEFEKTVTDKLSDIVLQSMFPIIHNEEVLSSRKTKKREHFFSRLKELSEEPSVCCIKKGSEIRVKYFSDERFITFTRTVKLLFVNLRFDFLLPHLSHEIDRDAILVSSPYCLGVTVDDYDFPAKRDSVCFDDGTIMSFITHTRSVALVFLYDKIKEVYGLDLEKEGGYS
jgi:hypothetical protein